MLNFLPCTSASRAAGTALGAASAHEVDDLLREALQGRPQDPAATAMSAIANKSSQRG